MVTVDYYPNAFRFTQDYLATEDSVGISLHKLWLQFSDLNEGNWETVKTADWGYVRLYCCRPKSVTAGLGCGLGCTPALSVMTALLWQLLRRYQSERYLYILYLK